VEHARMFLVVKWRKSGQHFVEKNSYAEDIKSSVMAVKALQHLRTQVLR